MKKISLTLAALAMLSVGVFTACSSDDKDPEVTPVVVDTNNTLVVTSNVSSTFSFAGQTQTGTTATFTTPQASGTLTVTASGYVKQESEINFSSDNNAARVEVKMVKASTNQVDQAAAKGSTVTNDNANSSASGASAGVEVPASVNITGNTTDPFSVTAYVPAASTAENVSQNSEVDAPVVAVSCTPDGAQFSEPVTVKITIPDAAGCEFECPNSAAGTGVTVSGNTIAAQVSHFSVIPFNLKAKAVSVTEGKETSTGSVLLKNGSNEINFQQRAGFSSSVTGNGAKYNFLKNSFGNGGNVGKKATFTSNASGSATYTVTQNYKDYTFQSGTQTFTARVYGTATVEITNTTTDTSAHSGGSAR